MSKENKKIIEIELSKNKLDELAENLDSDNFRNYGYGHIELDNGDLLLIRCNDLVKNREEYEKHLTALGLKSEEIIEHLAHTDKRK